MTSARRCVCGQSGSFPICDGSHTKRGWRCADPSTARIPLATAASPHLELLADRLAHRFKAVSVHRQHEPVRVQRLVLICNGHGLESLQATVRRTQAEEVLVLCVGVKATLLQHAFPHSHLREIPDEPLPALWAAAERACESPLPTHAEEELPRIFLSHAVADERALFPVIETLRQHLDMKLFVCSDSISPGAGWHQAIEEELRRSELFLFGASERANESVYCAYEAGAAVALGKKIRVISLDHSPLPAYLAHLQASNVPQLMMRKPWLTFDDAILAAILDAIGLGS